MSGQELLWWQKPGFTTPGINYANANKFRASPGAMYLINGGKCGDCGHFPLCSRHGDKSATMRQDYCARPDRGFMPLVITMRSTKSVKVGDSIPYRVLDIDVEKASREGRVIRLYNGEPRPLHVSVNVVVKKIVSKTQVEATYAQ